MRTLLLISAAATLAACTPPAPRQDAPAPSEIAACNDVTPDMARQVRVEEASAVAAAASDLRGGRIAPGVYDLARAARVGAATGWADTRAVALAVTESSTGAVTFNWAGAAPGGQADRWTAAFTETPQARLSYTCGRIGDVPAAFAADDANLTLRLQDGAGGSLELAFQRRP